MLATVSNQQGIEQSLYSSHQTPYPPAVTSPSTRTTMAAAGIGLKPYVEILVQPKQRGFRFRYECEGRSAGSIPGEDSTNENKTYPSIKIHNTNGLDSIVVVSTVTKDNPPRPHPHSLVGKDCQKGVCTVRLRKTNVATFTNLGIQCTKKKEVPKALEGRKEIRVDPFGTGFDFDHNNVDLATVRLCFQVFLPDTSGKFNRIIKPVVSQPIYDKKSVLDLGICRISKQAGSVAGMDEVFLLCEKVNKDDIEIRFFEEGPEGLIWEARGDFSPQDVHRQVAIVFRTPPYKDRDIKQPVTVGIQLKRPSDGVTSEHLDFQYIPEDRDPECIDTKRKRKKLYFEHMADASSDIQSFATGMMMKNEPQDSKSILRRKILNQKDQQRQMAPQAMGGPETFMGLNAMGSNYMAMQQQPVPSSSSIMNLPGSGPMDTMVHSSNATLNQLVGDQASGGAPLTGMDESAQQLLSNMSDGEIASNTSDLLRMLTESSELGESSDLISILGSEDLNFDFSGQGQPK